MSYNFLLPSILSVFIIISCKKVDPPVSTSNSANTENQELFSGGTCNSFGWIIPGDGVEMFVSVQQTNDDGYLVLEEHGIDKVCENNAVLYKLNCFGIIEWKDSLNQESTHFPLELIRVKSGGFIISSFYGCGLYVGGVRIGRLIRLDDAGNLLWTNDYEIGIQSHPLLQPTGIIESPDHGYLICGSIGSDAFVVKLDENGNKEWDKTHDTEAWYKDIAVDENNNIYITGEISVNGEKDSFLAKLDMNGDTLWTKHIDRENIDNSSRTVLVDSDENIYVAGHNEYDNKNSFVSKFDSNGDLIWDQYLNNHELIYTDEMIFDANNQIICDAYDESGYLKLFRLDKNSGAIIDIYDTGTSGWANQISNTDDGGFIVSGTINTEEFPYDPFVLKVSPEEF